MKHLLTSSPRSKGCFHLGEWDQCLTGLLSYESCHYIKKGGAGICEDLRALPHLVTTFTSKCFKFQWRNEIPNKWLSSLCFYHPGRVKGLRGWWWHLAIHVWIDVARGGPQARTHGEMALVHTSSNHRVRAGWWSHSGWEGAVCWVFLAAAKSRIEQPCNCSDLQCGPARNLRRCKGVLQALLRCFMTAVSSALHTCALSLLYHIAWKRRQSHTQADPWFPEDTMKADKTL